MINNLLEGITHIYQKINYMAQIKDETLERQKAKSRPFTGAFIIFGLVGPRGA